MIGAGASPGTADMKKTSAVESVIHRRDALKVGGVAAAATLLPPALASSPALAEESAKAKSVIFLWMAGGVTHIDSFDPKPQAPIEVRGMLGDIATSSPASGSARRSRTREDRRQASPWSAASRTTQRSPHQPGLHPVGPKGERRSSTREPNMGSVIWRLHGPRNGLPAYIAVPGVTRPGPPPYNFFVGGWLGAVRAVLPGGQPRRSRFHRRREARQPAGAGRRGSARPSRSRSPDVPIDRALPPPPVFAMLSMRRWRGSTSSTPSQSMPNRSITTRCGCCRRLPSARPSRSADVPDEVREAYGRTKIGGRCLQARRLVEAGARFVMVDYGYDPDYGNVWDNHNAPSQNHPPIQEMCRRGYHLAGMDKAFAALIRDLDERGLLDSTLVCFITEFGRTPHINKARRARSLGRGRLALLRRRGSARWTDDRRHGRSRGRADHPRLLPRRRGGHTLFRTGNQPPRLHPRHPEPSPPDIGDGQDDSRIVVVDRAAK
jgi:hypothetical protein